MSDTDYSEGVTNTKRAQWAMVAVRAFAHETGMIGAGEETETAFGDLLADMMHLADRLGINWIDAEQKAIRTYEEELAMEKQDYKL